MENRYNYGKIYKVWDNAFTKCYIGSTTETLSQRMARHRVSYNIWKRGSDKGYYKVFDLFDEFGVENCKIEWVEDYSCNSKKELEAREGKFQREEQCINKRVAGRSSKEYYDDNREQILERKREYYQENKEDILQKTKDYTDNNKDKVLERKKLYYTNNKDTINQKNKVYAETNKDKIKEYHAEWYSKNKDKFNEDRKTRIDCECGGRFSKNHKARHLQSNIHQEWLNSQTSEV